MTSAKSRSTWLIHKDYVGVTCMWNRGRSPSQVFTVGCLWVPYLSQTAQARQTAVIDVLQAAIDALERQEFLRGLARDYQQLAADPARWEQYLAERQEWDTLA